MFFFDEIEVVKFLAARTPRGHDLADCCPFLRLSQRAMKTTVTLFAGAVLFLWTSRVKAEVVALDIHRREPFAGGKAFGDAGPYEKIAGVVRFAIDPKDPRNQVIVDLDLAPRNSAGKVEFASDFYILAPKDPAKGNGAIFYDVNNRGNKLALRMFNFAPGGNNLDKKGSEGDGFLMRRGYTVVWCGWIGEILSGDDRLLLQPPVALENGKPVRGLVRYETCADKKADALPLSRRPGHGSYPPTKEGEASGKLTWRMHEQDPRQEVPRDKWSLIRLPVAEVKQGVRGTLGEARLKLDGGFEPGVLYELICEAEGPIVQGTGFAATRDLISFLRHDASDKNPLRGGDGKPAIQRAYAFGVSQSGRFLRHLMWQGFNEDEGGRVVFDGLIPHVAGGGLGFFNHRFAQPTRHNGQHEEHLYPGDRFPFTYGIDEDPFTRLKGGINAGGARLGRLPKVMHTQSAAEYWHRSGSLVHTDPLGKRDADIPANVRIYAFGGTQHGPAGDPPSRGIAQNLANPGDYRPLLRALLDAMDKWVRDGKEPPPSVYPKIKDKTLVHWDQKSTGFTDLPGVRYPRVIQQPVFADYGPDFEAKGIIANEPPIVKGKYTVLVPRSGGDGNDLGCLLPAEVAVPLATYTGWNLRAKHVGAENALASLMGSYIPLPKNETERKASGDPRFSVPARYGNFDAYRKQFENACRLMMEDGYLLEEDARRLIAGREKAWNAATK
jgi:Alpha/beta hydrolase domain